MVTFCKKRITVIIVVAFFISNSNAQTNQYSLMKLVEMSKSYLPLLLQKQAIINSAKAGVKDVKHSFLPKLYVGDEVNVGTDNSMAGSYLPEIIVPSVSSGVTAANDYQAASGNIASFYSNYTLVNFGLHRAQLNQAKSYVNLGYADYEKELYNTKLQICQLYFDYLQSQSRLKVEAQNIDRYQKIFEVIKALSSSGISAGADTSLAKAELSSAKVSYNKTYGNINQLKQQISYFTGIPFAQLNIDTLTIGMSDDVLAAAGVMTDSAKNPFIDYYVKQKEIFLANDKVIRKSYLPRVSLGLSSFARGSSIQYSDEYKSLATGLGYQRFNYMVGIGVSYDLFSGIYKKDKLAINNFQIQASDYALKQEQLEMKSTNSQSDFAIETATKNLLEIPTQEKAAKDVFLQKTAQYKAGLITLIDLTNATFVLYRSQIDYVEAMNDWYSANLLKAEATGNLDLFIKKIK